MMTQNVTALVRYRIEQADEALEAAKILAREGSLSREEVTSQLDHASHFVAETRKECLRLIGQ